MQIFVKIQNGKTLTLEITRQESISTLKSKIFARVGIPPEKQLLTIFQLGKELEKGFIIKDYNIQQCTTLILKDKFGPPQQRKRQQLNQELYTPAPKKLKTKVWKTRGSMCMLVTGNRNLCSNQGREEEEISLNKMFGQPLKGENIVSRSECDTGSARVVLSFNNG
jgi:hypothetical protein